METAATLRLFAAAFGASALGGVLGMASGVFIVPILTLLFGLDIHAAIGASIVSVVACSCASAAPYIKARLTNIRLAIVLETATTSGALTGVLLIGIVPTAYLYGLFSVILSASAVQMLARRHEVLITTTPGTRSWATALRLQASFPDGPQKRHVPYNVGSVPTIYERRESLIASLLFCGTWIASIVVGAGVLIGLFSDGNLAVAKAGIALFISLPIARVALMLTVFIRERDYAYVVISGLVLAIIVISMIVGLHR